MNFIDNLDATKITTPKHTEILSLTRRHRKALFCRLAGSRGPTTVQHMGTSAVALMHLVLGSSQLVVAPNLATSAAQLPVALLPVYTWFEFRRGRCRIIFPYASPHHML